jgi:hypothetical protein
MSALHHCVSLGGNLVYELSKQIAASSVATRGMQFATVAPMNCCILQEPGDRGNGPNPKEYFFPPAISRRGGIHPFLNDYWHIYCPVTQ